MKLRIEIALILAFASMVVSAQTGKSQRFVPEEATISSIHAKLSGRMVTCVQVIQSYLNRIEAYDHRGPALNSIITVNPHALDTAAEMDRLSTEAVRQRPPHCMPVILKDNYDTADMPTTGGSLTLANLFRLPMDSSLSVCAKPAPSLWPKRT
jgi:Asp-tRNA(Asn)/Glu-tRNA(Gln) amidotransferase A subunit family amidase